MKEKYEYHEIRNYNKVTINGTETSGLSETLVRTRAVPHEEVMCLICACLRLQFVDWLTALTRFQEVIFLFPEGRFKTVQEHDFIHCWFLRILNVENLLNSARIENVLGPSR